MARLSWRKEAIVSELLKQKENGITISGLAQILRMERHTLSKHLKSLEKQGLVTRRNVGVAILWFAGTKTQVSAHSEVASLAKLLLTQISAETPVCFAVVDQDLVIRRVNESFKTVYGALHGNKILQIFARRNVQVKQKLLQLFDTGDSMVLEVSDRKRNTVQLTATKLNDPKQRLLIVFVEDLSRLRAIRNELEKVAAAIESSKQLVCITDHRGSIEYVNGAFESVTGYSRRELVGKNPRVLKSGLYGKDFYKRLWKTIKSGKTFQEIFIDRKKNGELYYEEKMITPLSDERGNITHYISSGRVTSQPKV